VANNCRHCSCRSRAPAVSDSADLTAMDGVFQQCGHILSLTARGLEALCPLYQDTL